MESINQVAISGRVANDPILRGQDESALLAFPVCVNARGKVDGEWGDIPNFIDCVLFGRRAETLSNMLHKGDEVYIAGSLRQNSWEKDGQKRSRTEVKVSNLLFNPKRVDVMRAPEVANDDIPF